MNDSNKVQPVGTHKHEYININHDTKESESEVAQNHRLEVENDETDNQRQQPPPSTKMTKQKRKKGKKQKIHKCSFCPNLFWNKQDRECHVNKKHKFKKPYRCEYQGCNKEFYGATQKCRHQRTYHKEWYQRNKQYGIQLVHYNPKEVHNRNKQQKIKNEKCNKHDMKSPNKYCDKSSNKPIFKHNDTSGDKNKCEISDNEMREMRKICIQLELRKRVVIKPRIYGGYSSHLAIYKDIIKIVEMTDNDERQMYINSLSVNKLRDIQSKIGSGGQCGRKQEMKEGFIKMLPQLQASMVKNGNSINNLQSNTTNNMMNMNDDIINNVEKKMDSDRVQEDNNTNNRK